MPRLGMGIPIVGGAAEAAVLAVEDFVFLNDVSGELTPVDTSSRTNKILQSQTFKTTWTTNNAAIPNDLYEAPNNSTTAQAITASSAGASSVFLQQIVATTSGETYTYSLHAKKDSTGFVSLQFGDGTTTRKAWFNLSTGAATNTSNILTSSFDKMDDDWFRFSITFQADVTTSSSFVRIFAASVAGSTSTSASITAGNELIYIWGAQLEEDSRPTAYIVTTNAVVNVATTELGDLSNVWDFDGTDIMLEVDPENEGAFEEATANLVTNHDFAADSDWSLSNGASISGGQLTLPANSANISASQNIGDQTGNTLELTYTVVSSNISGGNFRVGGLSGGSVVPSALNLTSSVGTHTVFIEVPTSGSNNVLDIYLNSGVTSGSLVLDNVTVKEYAIKPLNV